MHKSKKLAYILIVILFGCGIKGESIMLDHTTQYTLPDGYNLLHISQIESDYYKSLFAESVDNSLILYKVLKGKDVKIYISVGFETNLEKLETKILSNTKAQVLAKDLTGSDSFVIFQKIDSGVFVVHYLKELASGNRYLFSAVSNNENLLDQKFADQYFAELIISK
jgi:hypothetical protein